MNDDSILSEDVSDSPPGTGIAACLVTYPKTMSTGNDRAKAIFCLKAR
ncbi:MAG: hypothetical protein IH931_01445 [candidate division Zixibacteria bacterium]|nr:hypothetical protein [candidate division Zixibacteria bacterium]